MDAVRKCFEAGGLEKEEDKTYPVRFLIGYRGGLYSIGGDLQVNEFLDGYTAIGSGADFALGSLYASEALGPHERVRCALEAAAHFSGTVREPFYTKSL